MNNQPQSEEENGGPAAADVVAYLRAHPGFFAEHEYLLREISLPHPSGKAISLVERQISLYREQRDKYERQLLDLIDAARENDQFFEKSKRLLMNLLEVTELDEVLVVLQDSFLNDFEVDYCSLVLIADKENFPVTNLAFATREAVEIVLGRKLLDAKKAFCGQLKDSQCALLYAEQAAQVKSAAVMPVIHGNIQAVLSIGSRERDHFHSHLDSIFLSCISEALGRILPGLMAKESACQTQPE